MWNIISAKFISPCSNLECMHFYGIGGPLYTKLAVGQIRTCLSLNLADMMFHRRMQSKPLLYALDAHALLTRW